MKNLAFCAFLLLLTCCSSLCDAAESETLGIVSQRPAEGRSVPCDAGFMVAYTTTIPGTDVEFTMVPVPGGEYEFARGEETIKVRLEPFWMGKTEVTWGEYKEYMKLGIAFDRFERLEIRQLDEANDDNRVDAVTAPSDLHDPDFVFENGERPTQPAVSMRQYAAKQYTKWLSLISDQFYRLPSEAEWEYTCLAGSKGVYSFGDDEDKLDEYAWYDDANDWETGDVGTKLPNAWGLHDMHGNAAEWVLDGATAEFEAKQAIAWPTEEYNRIAKGGSWISYAEECCVRVRLISSVDWLHQDPDTPQSPWWLQGSDVPEVGFRLLRPLDPPQGKQLLRYWDADFESIQKAIHRKIGYGRGERGLVDPTLPAAMKNLFKEKIE